MVFTTLPPHLPSADGHRHTHRVEAMGAEAWDSFSTDYVAVVKLLDELDALPDIAREWAESPPVDGGMDGDSPACLVGRNRIGQSAMSVEAEVHTSGCLRTNACGLLGREG